MNIPAAPELPPPPVVAARPAVAAPWRWRLIHGLVAIGIGLLAVLWLSVGWVVEARRDEAIRAEFRQNANVALVLQEQTERDIATVD